MPDDKKQVSVVMGSRSDWETMQHCVAMLDDFQIPCEVSIVSAHRTPDWLVEYAEGAESRGVQIIIAAAGGAAHLPGMIAAKTHLPVLGVPIKSAALNGIDSLLSIVQMPAGIPVGTLAISKAGAINAAILATSILSLANGQIREKLVSFRREQTAKVMEQLDPRITP